MFIPVTATGTKTSKESVLSPSSVLTVMVDVPDELAVSLPVDLSTLTTSGFDDENETFLLVALAGRTSYAIS